MGSYRCFPLAGPRGDGVVELVEEVDVQGGDRGEEGVMAEIQLLEFIHPGGGLMGQGKEILRHELRPLVTLFQGRPQRS